MHRLEVPDAQVLHRQLAAELRRSAGARLVNRLVCLILVANGHSCYELARCLRQSPRALERWVHRYAEGGVGALAEVPRGVPGSRRLTTGCLQRLRADLGCDPAALSCPGRRWTGRLLQQHLRQCYGIAYSPRQSARLLGQLTPRR